MTTNVERTYSPHVVSASGKYCGGEYGGINLEVQHIHIDNEINTMRLECLQAKLTISFRFI